MGLMEKIENCGIINLKIFKPGSIVLVDDFNHYNSFGEELDKHFTYELLSFSNEPFVPNGEHSWKIVKVVDKL